MRCSIISTVAVVATVALQAIGHPLVERAPDAQIDDTTILQYALTLEHLESAFYAGALAKFSQQDFVAAGYPSWTRNRFSEIAQHEKEHVQFLSSALGDKATKACQYKFPYTDVKSFVGLSQVFEGVGASAYTGAAKYIKNEAYLTAAASILSVEARHASWVASAVNKATGWSTSFETPLTLNEVYTIAAGAIISCPSTNPALPVKAYPALTFGKAVPGKTTSVNYTAAKGSAAATHVAFISGLTTLFAPIQNGGVAVPGGLTGQVYAVAVSNGSSVDDGTIVAGPAILEFYRDSSGNWMF